MKKVALTALAMILFTSPLHSESIAIVGAKIHTLGPQGTIENATVVLENGTITAIGKGIPVPSNARRLNGLGKVITPGLFNSMTQVGVVEVSAVEGTRDDSVEGDRITAAFDVLDALNPHSSLIAVNRIEGLTRVVVAPEAGGTVIAGQGAIIHLGGGSDFVVRSPVAMFAFLGEKGAELSGGARGAAMLRLREALHDARDYAANTRAYDEGNRREYALSRLDLEALVPVVRGQRPLVITVHRASDILSALRLKREFNLRLILAGADEGWKVAREIAAAGVPVLINPMDNLPGTFETLGATLENAARLHKEKVVIAFITGDAHNARNIKQAAGNAVAYGLPWDAALAAITSVPARIWGIDERYGTLEPGKDADLVIWDGDPLEVTTFADAVFIRGVEMPMESRQTKLRDRYRNLGGSLPPAYTNP